MRLIKVIEFKHAYRAALNEGSVALYKNGSELCSRLHPPEYYE